MSANTETTGADRTKCKAPAWCDFDDNDEGDPRLRVYVGARDGIYGVASTDGRRYCTPACRDARLPHIVAPAAHAERRKVEVGQRRKNHRDTFTVYAIEGDRAIVCQTGQVDPVNGYVHKGGTDCCWESVSVLEDCDLLADATPEPLTAKDVFGEIPPGGKLTNDTPVKFASAPPAQEAPKQWKEHARCGFPIVSSNREAAVTAVGKHQATCEKCSAQEAPKAAPVCCTKDKESTVCGGSLLKRVICHDVPPILMCDAHWILRESRLIEGAKAPYAGPTRLPRPQLAADWVEDCLGDVR